MKLFLPIFLFTFLISFPIFSQNKIGQIAYAQWDANEEKWNYYSFDNWTYDQQEREETFSHRDSRDSDYLPTNNLKSSSKYDAAGNLVEKNDFHFGPNEWINELHEYTYNSNHELIEQLVTSSNSWSDELRKYKLTFEKDENRKTTKTFISNGNGDFILESEQDSFFNEQSCLIKENIFSFHPDGSIQYGRSWEMEYAANCQLLSSLFSRWNGLVEEMKESNKYIYEYSNNGKNMVVTYLNFDESLHQWETGHVEESEFDDKGQRVKYFLETYRNNTIDSLLIFTSYTSKNEVEVLQKYQNQISQDGKIFRLTQRDSFSYHYSLEDQLILKEEFIQHYSNPVSRYTSTYEYFCNGQLKSEIFAGDHPYSRKDYRYFGGVDCPLLEGEGSMMLFPNPALTTVTIQANMLANSGVTIQVFTFLGQEVFSKKINQTSHQYQLDLSNLGKGNYIIMLSNEEGMLSEKLFIF